MRGSGVSSVICCVCWSCLLGVGGCCSSSDDCGSSVVCFSSSVNCGSSVICYSFSDDCASVICFSSSDGCGSLPVYWF